MLTQEDFKNQEGLNELTDAQLATIVALSNNQIKIETGKEKGVLYQRFDEDIQKLTGVEKEGSEAVHVYMKRAFNLKVKEAGKGSNETLKTRIAELETEITDLNEKIKSGEGNEALKTQLDTQTKLVEQLRTDQETLKADYDKKLQQKDEQYHATIVDNALNTELADLVFKSEEVIPKEVRDSFVANVKRDILSKYDTKLIDDGQGGHKLEYYDENGDIVRNPDNARHPFTSKELLTKGLSSILDLGRKQQGGGSKGGGQGRVSVDISSAKNQVEADEAISKQLAADGLVKGTDDFKAKQIELRQEHNISSLPLQ